MHTLQEVHRNPAARSNLLSAGLVASLHLAAIYTLLVALDVVPNPIKPTPAIVVRMIDQTQPKPQPPINPSAGVILAHPTVPIPHQPKIDTTVEHTGPTVDRPVTPVGPTTPPLAGPTLPVRAVAATHTIPPYPPLGIRLIHEGTTRLRIGVDEQGNVTSAEVVQSSGHEELDAAAVAWVKSHWRYQPAMQDGHAVSAVTNANVTFRLDQAHG